MLKKDKDKFLLLDFGRGSIKGIIFQPIKEKIKILNFQEEKIQKYSIFNGKDFEIDIIKKPAEKVINQLGKKEEILKLSKILFFPPDILRAEIFNLSFKRERKDKKIEKEEGRKIHQFILNETERKLFKKEGNQIEILKKKVLIEKISGYKVPLILGFRNGELSFKVLVIFYSQTYSNFFKKIKKNLGLENSKIFHPVESLINLIKRKSLENNQVFIDIGEKNTLISFFKEKEIESIINFPLGGLDFTKELSKILILKENEAEILKENFSQKKLSPNTEMKLKKIFQSPLNLWLKNFREKVGINLFANFYLFGGGSLFPLIKEELEREIKKEKIKFLLSDNLPIENKTNIKFSPKETSSLLKVFYSND